MPDLVERTSSRKLKNAVGVLVGLALFFGLVAGGIYFVMAGGGIAPSPASIVGDPIRVASDAGDRVYLLTSQWKSYKSVGRGSIRNTYTDLLIDVWAFDAAGATPIWRHRLTQTRAGVNMGRKLLGAKHGTLWLLDTTGPVGLSLANGGVVADTARIEAANPSLRGLVPTDARFYRFDADGLAFTAADGRYWRLGEGLAFAPADKPTRENAPKVLAPGVTMTAHSAGGTGTYAFQERGLSIGKLWLGMLDDEEAATFKARGGVGGLDPANHPRLRVWSAKVGSRKTFFGPAPVYSGFAPLPQGPEFINAGLLGSGITNALPVLLFKPDSVLVLHSDRLGSGGRYQLTRVSGPAGKPLWTASLPVEAVESVMPGKDTLVLTGRRTEDVGKGGASDRGTSVDQVVSVNLTTGQVGVYGLKVKATKPEEIPPSSTAPATPAAR